MQRPNNDAVCPHTLRHVAGIICLAVLVVAALEPTLAHRAHADDLTISYDAPRTGWDPSEPGLTPTALQRGFGELSDTPLDGGQVYAQPVVVGNTVIVATERDHVYAFDAMTGQAKWEQSVTTSTAPYYEPASETACNNIDPDLGVTATPVVDPATNTVYISARSWDGQNGNSAEMSVHALDVATGQERPGWPSKIQGPATNDANSAFDPSIQRDRPGLLMSGGVIYVAYASFCDFYSYKGWIAGVPTSAPASPKLYTVEPGSNGYTGGIWHSGGGIASDGPGRLFVITGNGGLDKTSPPTPQSRLGDSVIRLAGSPDGTLTPQDFFAPHNADQLDEIDGDLGAGGPVALPDSFGSQDHPHLMLGGGKQDILYLLDRDNLGGFHDQANQDGLARVGPMASTGEGIFNHPGVWGGDGGYVYEAPASYLSGAPLRAFRVSASPPSIAQMGASTHSFAYGAGSPKVTSNGMTNGSAVVWITDRGTNALRGYNAVPQNGVLQLATPASPSVRSAEKWTVPASAGNRLYVGTHDGHLLSFGVTLQNQAAVTGASQSMATTPGGGEGFTNLGGSLGGAPAVAVVPGTSTQPGTPIYVATGSDHNMYVRTPTMTWRPLTDSVVGCIDNPAATIVGNTLYVACQALDHSLWTASGTMNGSTPPVISRGAWHGQGGAFTSGMAMAQLTNTASPTIMGVGTDGFVWSHDVGQPGGVFTKQAWGCQGHPALARGNDTVFACHGWDNQLWYSFRSGGHWSAARAAGGALIDGPGLAASGPVARAYVEGTDHALWETQLLDPSTSSPFVPDGGSLQFGAGGSAF